jgi:flagellar motor switch protein FliN/FliY
MSPLQEIAHLANVPLEVEVELDRKIMTIAEILQLEPESVIRMTRSAGENIDVRIGGILIGYGEIVTIEDAVSVRITDFNCEE